MYTPTSKQLFIKKNGSKIKMFLKCYSSSQLNSQNSLSGNYWSTDDMNSFSGLSSLDMEPLPSLFPFSSCGAPYKYLYPTNKFSIFHP